MTRRAALLAAGALGLGLGLARAGTAPRALGEPALQAARPTQAVLQAVARAGGRRLVAVGERGLAIYSDDDGRSWTQAQVPVRCTLTALCFADARRGWAVGNMGVVLATEDGGAHWRRCLEGQAAAELALQAARAQLDAAAPGSEAQAQAQQLREDAQRLVAEGADKPLLDIALRADGTLLAVGAYGLAFASADGGRSWQPQMHRLPNPEGLSYYGLAERRGESLLFGEQGLLLRAAGPEQPFAAQAALSGGSLFGALVLREGPLLLLGLRGRLWRSAEPGAAWTPVQTPVEAALVAGTQLDDGRVLLAGAAGQVLVGEDGGQRLRPLALAQRFPFAGLAQARDGALLLVGTRGLLRLGPDDLQAALAGSPTSLAARTPAQ
ncbi:MAG: photosystem II stability/assembly factor-like protein [Pseudorhodoferax sp.]